MKPTLQEQQIIAAAQKVLLKKIKNLESLLGALQIQKEDLIKCNDELDKENIELRATLLVRESELIELQGQINKESKTHSIRHQLIEAAKPIRHCGDYGMLYYNPKTNGVILTLGDSDGDEDNGYTSFYKIKTMLSLPGITNVEIADEWSPNKEDGWEDLGRILGRVGRAV